MPVEIKRPGSDKWETGADLGGSVPIEEVVGSLLRYPTGCAFIVTKCTGLSEPNEEGTRFLQMEIYDPNAE